MTSSLTAHASAGQRLLTPFQILESDALWAFSHAVQSLSNKGIQYVHLMEPDEGDFDKGNLQITEVVKTFRPPYKGPMIADCRFDQVIAERAVATGLADLAGFGRASRQARRREVLR